MTDQTDIAAIILAAGEGSRMKSARPKALHEVGGRSLLAHAVAAAETLAPSAVTVVTGAGGEAVAAAALALRPDAEIAEQTERLETALHHHLMGSPDAIEGVMAYLERREPQWKLRLSDDWPEWPDV